MRPNEYTIAATCVLVAGVFNVVMGITWFLSFVIFFCIGTLWLLPMAFGILEIVLAVRMLNGQRVHSAVALAAVGVAMAIVNLNMIGVMAEIVALIMLMNPAVSAWMEADDSPHDAGW